MVDVHYSLFLEEMLEIRCMLEAELWRTSDRSHVGCMTGAGVRTLYYALRIKADNLFIVNLSSHISKSILKHNQDIDELRYEMFFLSLHKTCIMGTL